MAEVDKKTIMIVDDETITRRMLTSFVSRMGHSYIEAADGMEAVEILKNSAVDLIVLDLNMPKVSGYSILGAFEKIGINVPVIICSGTLHLSSDVEFIHGKKNYEFLSKPVTFNRFIEVIRSVFAKIDGTKEAVSGDVAASKENAPKPEAAKEEEAPKAAQAPAAAETKPEKK